MDLSGIDTNQLGAEANGVYVAEHAIDLPAHQHLLAQVRLHVGNRDGAAINLGRLAEGRKQF
jgi:hypothetical protein